MNAHAPDELTQARERLRRSRENLHRQIHGDGAPGARTPLARTLVTRGLQAFSGAGDASGGLKLGVTVAAAVVMLLARRKINAGKLGLILPIALAALKFARRR